jgi:hypothetical protein
MKVWRLNEFDWYVADTFEQAVTLAMADTGCTREETVDEYYSGEETDMDRKYYSEEDEHAKPHTFAELLAEITEPGFFISLE